MHTWTVLVAVACALAGCVAAQESDQTNPPPLPDVQATAEMTFNKCTGSTVSYRWTAGQHPSTPPDGWGEAAATSRPVSLVTTLSCERVRIADLERPVNIIMEAHTNVSVPPGCQANSLGRPVGLAFLAFSDEAVAAEFANLTHLSTAIGTFNLTESSAGHELDIRLAGGGKMNGMIVGAFEPVGSGLGATTLFASANGGLVQLNQTLTTPSTGFVPNQFQGTASSPFAMANAPQPFIGQSLELASGALTWRVSVHESTDCT